MTGEQELDKKIADYFSIPLRRYTKSMDACLKWILPNLSSYSISSAEDKKLVLVSIQERNGTRPANEINERPAMGFCLATEELIDRKGGSEFRSYESVGMDFVSMQPNYSRKNEYGERSGWQITFGRDLTLVGGKKTDVFGVTSLSEEQLKYALSAIKKAKHGEIELVEQG